MRFKVRKHIIFHIMYIVVAPLSFWNVSIFTKLIVLRSEACSDWPAIRCVVIGRIPQMLCPLPYCGAMSRHDDTKTIKPIINKIFVASSGDIITDYNDLYCPFTCLVASHHVNITAPAFVIGETLLKTHVNESSVGNNLNKKPYWVRSTDCPCKAGIAPLYRNSLWAACIVD